VDDDIKTRLLKPRLPEDEVPVPGIGTVRVRGLNRAEGMMVQAVKGTATQERLMLSLAMVHPTLTESEAGQWQKASPTGELEPVTRKIAELSGMAEGAAKEAYNTFRDEPGE
jgi:hypothetical protein